MRKRGEAELPPPYTRRWTFRRKAALLQALRSRTITLNRLASVMHCQPRSFAPGNAISSGRGFKGCGPLVRSGTKSLNRTTIWELFMKIRREAEKAGHASNQPA